MSEETQSSKSNCCVAFRGFVRLGLSAYDVTIEACGRRRNFCVGSQELQAVTLTSFNDMTWCSVEVLFGRGKFTFKVNFLFARL